MIRRTAALSAGILIAVGCDQMALPTEETTVRPSLSSENCWPPSPTCVERAMEPEENTRMDDLADNNIRDDDFTGICDMLRASLKQDLASGDFRVQVSAPYFPNQAGDRHNSVDISHIVQAYIQEGDDEDVIKIGIHETAHKHGYTDEQAYDAQDYCYQP